MTHIDKLQTLMRPCHCFRFMALLHMLLDVWTCRQQMTLTVLTWTHCAVVARWNLTGRTLLEVHILLHLLVLLQLSMAWTLTADAFCTVLTLYGSLCRLLQLDVALWFVQLIALELDRTIAWMMQKTLKCLSESQTWDSTMWSQPYVFLQSQIFQYIMDVTLHLSMLLMRCLWQLCGTGDALTLHFVTLTRKFNQQPSTHIVNLCTMTLTELTPLCICIEWMMIYLPELMYLEMLTIHGSTDPLTGLQTLPTDLNTYLVCGPMHCDTCESTSHIYILHFQKCYSLSSARLVLACCGHLTDLDRDFQANLDVSGMCSFCHLCPGLPGPYRCCQHYH